VIRKASLVFAWMMFYALVVEGVFMAFVVLDGFDEFPWYMSTLYFVLDLLGTGIGMIACGIVINAAQDGER
jgi:hypothetical protein